jgi:tetratricopeptide (TPR) repeat protein
VSTGPQPGAALLAGGRFHEAHARFAQALRADQASVAARIGLARACVGMNDPLTAGAWLADAMRLAPAGPEAIQLLADLLLAQQQFAQAAPLYARLLDELQQRSDANLLHAGYCREQLGDLEAAVALYREAVAVNPRRLEPQVNLAGVLWRLEDFEGALAHAQRAVELAPRHPHAQRILGTAWLNLNRPAAAERHLRLALELAPALHLAQLDLAFTLLLAGRLEEGWRRYEDRWNDVERLPRPAFWRAAHEWRGPPTPLAGKTVAVYAEQGWGDVLQFVRYLPRLQALGAEVRCVVSPELVTLVEASFPGVQCLVPGRDLTVQLHVALLDLPARLGTTLATIPAPVPYLRPPARSQARWRERLATWAGRRKVGLAWSGTLRQINNRNRAMPLSLLLPLVEANPDLAWFNLQQGEAGSFTDAEPSAHGLVDLTGDWSDFAESAAMIEQLDLVITVDTAVAHLAGALGKPVWLLLAPNADWRWLLAREDSPWYPSTRLFRRAHGEPRAAQVGRLRAAFSAWSGA